MHTVLKIRCQVLLTFRNFPADQHIPSPFNLREELHHDPVVHFKLDGRAQHTTKKIIIKMINQSIIFTISPILVVFICCHTNINIQIHNEMKIYWPATAARNIVKIWFNKHPFERGYFSCYLPVHLVVPELEMIRSGFIWKRTSK